MVVAKVIVEVQVRHNLIGMTKDQVLSFIKAHMGYYSDYDIAKLVKVLAVMER